MQEQKGLNPDHKETIDPQIIVPGEEFLFFDPRFTPKPEEESRLDSIILSSNRVVRINGLPDLNISFSNEINTHLLFAPNNYLVELTPFLKFPQGMSAYSITDEDYSIEKMEGKILARLKQFPDFDQGEEYDEYLETLDQDEFGLCLVARIDTTGLLEEQKKIMHSLRLQISLPEGTYESSMRQDSTDEKFDCFYPAERGPIARGAGGLQIVTTGITPEQAHILKAKFVQV